MMLSLQTLCVNSAKNKPPCFWQDGGIYYAKELAAVVTTAVIVVVVTAAANKDYDKDDNPRAVVVAEKVTTHVVFLLSSLHYILSVFKKLVTVLFLIFATAVYVNIYL